MNEKQYLIRLMKFIDEEINLEERPRSFEFNDGFRKGFVSALRMLRLPVSYRIAELTDSQDKE